MKKLILVLSVVAMAAFLLVGCLPKTNTAPVITYSASQTATTGTVFTSTVTATDAEGDTLTYLVSDGPTDMVIDSATGVISGWTPAAAGTETVLVTVSDDTLSSTLLVTITVTDPVEPVETDITIAVAGEYLNAATGKTYVKGGGKEITVTFPNVVENPVVKVGAAVVPVFTVDNKVFKGTGTFVGNAAVVITVSGVCDVDLCAAKSVVVDSSKPYAELEAKAAECACEDSYALTITSEQVACDGCVVDPGCCADKGSGLASWNVKIFDEDPWKVPTFDDPCDEPDCDPCCSDDPCVDPIAELDGTACPITITTECIEPEFLVHPIYGWYKDYFTRDYFVIATLTDNVGNKTTYYGRVRPAWEKADNYVEYFAEIFIEDYMPDYPECWCPAEDPSEADSVLGDCDGTPATECWEEEIILEPCPVVTFVPSAPIVGEEVTITIDYDVLGLEAVKPVGAVSAYVGPSIKTLPLGIPEEAQELVLTDNEDWSYTATYTFHQAGTDYIYVVDDCADCTPCKTGVTVAERVCPEIEVDDEVLFGTPQLTYIAAGTHTVTVTFSSPIPIEQVRVFTVGELTNDWDNPFMPDEAVELIISTSDDLTYTATTSFTGSTSVCTDEFIIVQYGESCCPVICEEMFMVDGVAPYAALEAEAEVCDADPGCDYDTGYEIVISVVTEDPECDPVVECCGDDCTEVVQWDLTIFMPDVDPLDECCVLDDTLDECDIFFEDSGVSCSDLGSVTPCITDEDYVAGNYPVIFHLTDLLGNETTYHGVLIITVDANDVVTAVLNNATLSADCQTWTSDGDGFIGRDCFPTI